MNHSCARYFKKFRQSLTISTLILLFHAGNQTVWAALPAGWSDADIGSPGMAGSASEAGGNWTVAGGGADIWTAADQFNFAYESTTNDVIVAQVLTVGNT